MSLGASSGPENRRDRIPVLATIHSCDVSTVLANSALATALSGTYAPTPVTRIPIPCTPRRATPEARTPASQAARSGAGGALHTGFRPRVAILEEPPSLGLAVLPQLSQE